MLKNADCKVVIAEEEKIEIMRKEIVTSADQNFKVNYMHVLSEGHFQLRPLESRKVVS